MSEVIRLTDRSRIVQARFWSKVDVLGDDDCWNWKGYTNPKGYGHFQLESGKPVRSHRMAFALAGGVEPRGFVCHTCDNRKCCNPSHLYEGTPLSNMHDMIQRGRQRHPSMAGERCGQATISNADARYILRWYKIRPTKEIADYLGCSIHIVHQVGSRRTWKHVRVD